MTAHREPRPTATHPASGRLLDALLLALAAGVVLAAVLLAPRWTPFW